MQAPAVSDAPQQHHHAHSQAHRLSDHVSTSIVADLVEQYPGSTSRELAERSGLCRLKIARRLPEAATQQRVRRVRKGKPRACTISGRENSLTWWPNSEPNAQ